MVNSQTIRINYIEYPEQVGIYNLIDNEGIVKINMDGTIEMQVCSNPRVYKNQWIRL